MKTALQPTEYMLRIFSPGSTDECFEDFVSPTPFNAIAVGDVIDQINSSLAPGRGLRVTAVVHRLHQPVNAPAAHYTGVFTDEIALDEWHGQSGRS